ncbi:MAG: hypothetical protein ACSHYC_13260 [Alphaproteobacteria bacterium]
MDDNKFFKFVWRINAMALALILILGVAILAWQLLLSDVFKGQHAIDTVNIDQADNTIVETLELSVVERVTGHDLFRVSLESEQQYRHQRASKETRQTDVNTGFYDPTTGEIVWLFPTSKQLISSVDALYQDPEKQDRDDSAVVLMYLVTFVDQDSSNDQRLSNSDEKSVLAVEPNGKNGNIILSGLKSDPIVWSSSTDQYTIFFTTQDGQQSVTYDPKAMALGVIRTIAIP